MMSFLTYITGFFMDFELLPILTDYEIQKKGGWNFKKIFSSETTEPISTKLLYRHPLLLRHQTNTTGAHNFKELNNTAGRRFVFVVFFFVMN
jgi:hypothetical protein